MDGHKLFFNCTKFYNFKTSLFKFVTIYQYFQFHHNELVIKISINQPGALLFSVAIMYFHASQSLVTFSASVTCSTFYQFVSLSNIFSCTQRRKIVSQQTLVYTWLPTYVFIDNHLQCINHCHMLYRVNRCARYFVHCTLMRNKMSLCNKLQSNLLKIYQFPLDY